MWTKSNDKNEQKKALEDPAGGLAKAGVWHSCAKSFMKLQSKHKLWKETSAVNGCSKLDNPFGVILEATMNLLNVDDLTIFMYLLY